MGFWNIVPILGNHVEDQLRVEGSPPPEPSDQDAFAHELDDKPQPYLPAGRSEATRSSPSGAADAPSADPSPKVMAARPRRA